MQRSPPAFYLAGNIFMWGVLLMCQAASQSFGALVALRVLSGAFEAIADPAFMLIVSTYYRREEQPSRISYYYLWNGIGVAGGGLIGRTMPQTNVFLGANPSLAQATALAMSEDHSTLGDTSSSWSVPYVLSGPSFSLCSFRIHQSPSGVSRMRRSF